ncbi:MAG: response regulator transcription factor [Lachnospiraceae bacterium]|nr:response regulator transcription factor [Lachnospiraceae bacterium]
MAEQKILICDDDFDITETTSIFLRNAGYKVFKCYNGKEALACLKKNHIDLVIMDIMMPGENGLTVVSRIRETSDIPIIFLSAKSEVYDKVTGLDTGADDYMTKPFAKEELISRIKAILKRSSMVETSTSKNQYEVGNLKLDYNAKTVTLNGKDVKLTPIEYKILAFFMKNTGKVLSSNDIYKEVWEDKEAYNIENTIAVHIRHIREKIEENTKDPKFIKVVWGIGYKMEAF